MQTNYYRKKANPNTGTTIFEMNAGFHEQFIPLLGIKDQKKFVLKPMLLRGGFSIKKRKSSHCCQKQPFAEVFQNRYP